jgi:UDP-glucose 4-epimerase
MKIKGGKFLITGGVSLIGSHVAEQLLDAGAREIVLFDNFSLGSADTIPELLKEPRIKLVRGDILRVNELFDALEEVDGVFAIAGFLTLPLSLNPSLGLAVNVQGMLNIYEACRYRGVKKVIFSSSVAVYGETEAELTEETDSWSWCKQQPGAALYGGSKIMGENIGKLYHDRYGIQAISLRYASVYGERQHLRAVNSVYIIDTYDRIRRGEAPIIPDDGKEVHDYIHVADIARANLMAMESEVSRESFNVATGTSTSLNQLVDTILKLSGSKLKPEHKSFEGKIRATTSSTLKFSNKKIEKMLGWRPQVSLEDGITRLMRWRDQEMRRAG